MNLEQLKSNWEELGESDPYWAVLTDPSKINNQWNTEAFYKTGQVWLNSIFESFDLENHLSQKSHALDFGCGPGRLTQALCHKFEQVVGVDISSSMVRKANDHNQFPTSCIYRVNNTNDLSQFTSDQFDLVISFITLQHIEQRFALNYIKEFARVVKTGGCALFNVPHKPPRALKLLSATIGLKGVNLIRQIYYRKKAVIEMHWISETELQACFNANGLETLQIRKDNGVGKHWGSNMYLLKKMDTQKH